MKDFCGTRNLFPFFSLSSPPHTLNIMLLLPHWAGHMQICLFFYVKQIHASTTFSVLLSLNHVLTIYVLAALTWDWETWDLGLLPSSLDCLILPSTLQRIASQPLPQFSLKMTLQISFQFIDFHNHTIIAKFWSDQLINPHRLNMKLRTISITPT